MFALLAAAMSLALPSSAETQTGEIRVEARDVSGAAMEASGKVQNIASGVSRNFQTTTSGPTVLSGLPYGSYRIELAKTGFTTQTAIVDVSSPAPLLKTISMLIGAGSFKVDVVAVTPLAGVDLPVDQTVAYSGSAVRVTHRRQAPAQE